MLLVNAKKKPPQPVTAAGAFVVSDRQVVEISKGDLFPANRALVEGASVGVGPNLDLLLATLAIHVCGKLERVRSELGLDISYRVSRRRSSANHLELAKHRTRLNASKRRQRR